ncbi:hypothetical protein [Oceanobacillus salinisoli]|uniref:hypothetical protein n=1 Tax=Oceanobacillus salinisoli TaxID=2678611 RepID=UPI0012E27952|nr:hypothetical protein [Oceanobacillus salinisoli]
MDPVKIVQSHVLNNGLTLEEYFENNFVQFPRKWRKVGENTVEFIVDYPRLSNYSYYRWKVKEGVIHALNGKAIQVTPEFNRHKEELIKRKNEIPEEEMEIYNYIQDSFKKLEQEDGEYSPEKHDSLVLNKASKKYGLPLEDVDKLLVKVERKIYNL